VKEYGAEHTDVYAGIVYGGHVYVGFTQDAADHLARLRQRVDDPDAVRAFIANHTLAECLATAARIRADMRALREEGIEITGVGADQYRSGVGVTLRRPDDGQEATLRERYGALLLFDYGDFVHGTGTSWPAPP
jgi:hypothetical protein